MAQRFDKNNRDIRRLIPANIKLLRSAHGLSQETVAELTNLSRSCYCSYECGAKLPTFEALYNLSRLYDVNLNLITALNIPQYLISLLGSDLNNTDPNHFAEKYIMLSDDGKLQLKRRIEYLLIQERGVIR